MKYVNLNVKSHYSLLGSTIDIPSLIGHAKERNLEVLSLVEDGSMHSAVKFFSACKKNNIRPVIGVGLDVKSNSGTHRWTLFARNTRGYRILLKLTSDMALSGQVEAEEIFHHAEHIIICINILAADEFAELKNTENCYIALSTAKQINHTTKLKHLTIPFVFLNEIRILSEDDLPLLKVLTAIRENVNISQVSVGEDIEFLSSPDVKYYASIDDLLAEAMKNTVIIANDCRVELGKSEYLLPKFNTPTGDDSFDYLKALCFKGMKRRYVIPHDVHFNRLSYELEIIERMGFSDYFLIVWDFVKYAKVNGILVGPGRGSAAGSIVSYVLGITNVDPIKYDLLFERFLNPQRISLPDIDIDFQDDRRDEVIEYVKNKYGEFFVCQIATFGTFGARASWRDTARVHGLTTPQINAVARHLSSRMTLAQNVKENGELQKYLETNPHQSGVFKMAMKLAGFPRHISTHAAGVIISPADLRNFTALTNGSTEVYLSQYEAGDLEEIGLLKMDFLGLRNLTMIKEISALINKFEDESFDISKIPLDDPLTFSLIANANTTGIFQLESAGMRQALRQVMPSNIEDIISVLALFRPGPMANIPMFAARKHGKLAIVYDHESLEPILKTTYGIIVYQEQIMQIVNKVAGFTLGEADILRRAISKKDNEIMQKEANKFVSRAKGRGYEESVSKKIFELILKFANYGFNRSHAASYAMISYEMAYLKANYPQFFMTSVLMTQMGSQKATATAIKEARQLGINILPISINQSEKSYHITKEGIRLGFLSVKQIGIELVSKLLDERAKGEFIDFYDFIKRTHNILSEKNIASLINLGALDEFGYKKSVMILNVSNVLTHMQYGPIAGIAFEMANAQIDEFASDELMEAEFESLGFYLQTHPIRLFKDLIDEYKWVTPTDLIEYTNKAQVNCIGFVSRVREIRDKNGNLMAFWELTDEISQLDVTIFNREYNAEYKQLVNHVVVLNGVISVRNEKVGLNFNNLVTKLT